MDYSTEYEKYYCPECRKYQNPPAPLQYRPPPPPPEYLPPPLPPPPRKQFNYGSPLFILLILLILIMIIAPFIILSLIPSDSSSDFDYNNRPIYEEDDEEYEKEYEEEDKEEKNNKNYYQPCNEGNFTRLYAWIFNGTEHNFQICIPEETFYYYATLPRIFEYSDYVQVAENNLYKLADALKDMAEENNYNTVQTMNFILSFVQCLEYTSDEVTTGFNEYPRFAVESLVESGGDCEDTSILFAGFMKNLGIDTILLFLPGDSPNHAAVGISIEEPLYGTYFAHNGKKYFYCETTAGGWDIGYIPDEYKGVQAKYEEL
jgi:hypothetical protein